MTDELDALKEMAAAERKTRRGRRGYSEELREALRSAAKSHTKTAIRNATKISFPTLIRIIGPSAGRKEVTTKSRSSNPKAAAAAATSYAVAIQVSVNLPSGTKLTYTDLDSLRADAQVLAEAVIGFRREVDSLFGHNSVTGIDLDQRADAGGEIADPRIMPPSRAADRTPQG